ncbi:unnamed protein product, partial [Symbiodinium sp. KB8]
MDALLLRFEAESDQLGQQFPSDAVSSRVRGASARPATQERGAGTTTQAADARLLVAERLREFCDSADEGIGLLDLSGVCFRDGDLSAALVAVRASPLLSSLRHLDVTGARIGEHFIAQRCDLGDVGAEQLCLALSGRATSPLRTLDLSSNDCGPATARAIAHLLALPDSSLERLCLDGNRIGDEGAADIAAVLCGTAAGLSKGNGAPSALQGPFDPSKSLQSPSARRGPGGFLATRSQGFGSPAVVSSATSRSVFSPRAVRNRAALTAGSAAEVSAADGAGSSDGSARGGSVLPCLRTLCLRSCDLGSRAGHALVLAARSNGRILHLSAAFNAFSDSRQIAIAEATARNRAAYEEAGRPCLRVAPSGGVRGTGSSGRAGCVGGELPSEAWAYPPPTSAELAVAAGVRGGAPVWAALHAPSAPASSAGSEGSPFWEGEERAGGAACQRDLGGEASEAEGGRAGAGGGGAR